MGNCSTCMLLYDIVLDLSSKKETFCNNLIFNPFNLIVIHPVECLRVIVGQGQETKRQNALNSTDGLKFGRYRLVAFDVDVENYSPSLLSNEHFNPMPCCFPRLRVQRRKQESRFQFELTERKKDIRPKTTTIKRSLHQLYS